MLSQPVGEGAGLQPLEERGVGRRLARPRGVRRVPLGLRGLAALDGLTGVLEHAGRHLEGLLGVEAEHLLGGRDLVGAERGAVGLAGVLSVGGGPGDDRVEHDEARLVGDRVRLADRVVQRGHVLLVRRAVVGPVDVLDVPAVGLVAGADVLAEGDVGVVLDRDPVVVVDERQVAELLHAGDCGGLGGHALLDVTVGAQRVDLVVERRVAERGVRVEEAVLAARGHRHADGVADALAERAGGGLDPGGVAVLGVTGGLAAPGAQRLEVIELEAPAAQEELDVEGQAGVSAGQHEAVATGPVGVGGVVAHHLLEQQVRRRRQAHRRTGVAVPDLLDGVHGQHPHGVDGLVVQVGPVQLRGCRGHAVFPSTAGLEGGTSGPTLAPTSAALKASPSLLTPGDRLRGASCLPPPVPEDLCDIRRRSSRGSLRAGLPSVDRSVVVARRRRGVRRADQAARHRAAAAHHRAGDVLRRGRGPRPRSRRRHRRRRDACRRGPRRR